MRLKKAANIETLYTEIPFAERFAAAKKDGFEYVEFWGWLDKNLDEISDRAGSAGIGILGFNGDAAYSLVDPEQKKPYLEYLRRSLETAKKIGSLGVTIHSNALGDGGVVVNHYDGVSHTVKLCSMYDMLLDCVSLADSFGINLNLEGLNITTDHVGNFLVNTQMAAEICRLINSPRLKVLYDVYHMQLNEGSICDTLGKYIDQIGHIHVADVPGRHEPGTGEINYPFVLGHLEALGYKGAIGYELFPKTTTEAAVKAIMSLVP